MGLGGTVQLAPDGSMTVQQIMSMNVSRILRMTITEIEEAMRESDRERGASAEENTGSKGSEIPTVTCSPSGPCKDTTGRPCR